MKNSAAAIYVLALLLCCNPPKHKEPTPVKVVLSHVVVLNEGGYTYNNAEISIYNADSNKVENDIFRRNNQKPLGDVLQSAASFDHRFYWVLNNSEKVVVTDSSFKEQYTISGFKSPRYIYIVDHTKAYVSDLYDTRIAVVDLSSKKIHKYIPCKAGTEQFLQQKMSSYVWVSNSYTDKIYKIDTQTDQLVDSITTPYGPSSMVYDRYDHIWVGCSGQKDKGQPSALVCIDVATQKILKKLEADTKGTFGESRLCINASKDTLFWTAQGIKKAPITADTYPTDDFIEANGRILYGLNVNPHNGDVYVCDAVDYSQNGYVIRFDKKGHEISKFKVGKIPNGVFFK